MVPLIFQQLSRFPKPKTSGEMDIKVFFNEERQHIGEFCLANHRNGKLPPGTRIEATQKFDCSLRTISTIWARAKVQLALGMKLDMRSHMMGHPGHNKITIDMEALKALPANSRRTIRSTGRGLNISKTTVQRAVASKVIRSHTNSIKPLLTVKCKNSRLKFCLSKLDNNLTFKEMDHVIHIDEKWFYMSKPTVRYLLAPDEVEPYRTCSHKSHIPKLMFICAVSRPIFGEDGQVLFDGKIGTFPFVKEKEAIYTTPRRPAGTIEIVPLDKVTRQITREKIIDEVIPAIKAKWPEFLSKNIYIQQDNATPHIKNNDADFRRVADSDGFHINLVSQPAHSPDLNVLDLGFFNSIQTLQYETPASDVVGLLNAVNSAFERDPPSTLNKVFVSQQACMIEVIKILGSNNYKLPHMNKDAMIREGTLPRLLTVDEGVVRAGVEHLISVQDTRGIEVTLNRNANSLHIHLASVLPAKVVFFAPAM